MHQLLRVIRGVLLITLGLIMMIFYILFWIFGDRNIWKNSNEGGADDIMDWNNRIEV